MKKSLLVMFLAMMFFAVQGYAQRSKGDVPTSCNRVTNTSSHGRQIPPSRNERRRPRSPQYTHGYNHQHHVCEFETWKWVTFLGYNQRFICHTHYCDRFFDRYLGVYIYGSLSSPKMVRVNGMTFYRDGRYLVLQREDKILYPLSVEDTIIFPNNSIQIITGKGYATLYIYDTHGNSSTYYL